MLKEKKNPNKLKDSLTYRLHLPISAPLFTLLQTCTLYGISTGENSQKPEVVTIYTVLPTLTSNRKNNTISSIAASEYHFKTSTSSHDIQVLTCHASQARRGGAYQPFILSSQSLTLVIEAPPPLGSPVHLTLTQCNVTPPPFATHLRFTIVTCLPTCSRAEVKYFKVSLKKGTSFH